MKVLKKSCSTINQQCVIASNLQALPGDICMMKKLKQKIAKKVKVFTRNEITEEKVLKKCFNQLTSKTQTKEAKGKVVNKIHHQLTESICRKESESVNNKWTHRRESESVKKCFHKLVSKTQTKKEKGKVHQLTDSICRKKSESVQEEASFLAHQ